MFEVSVLFRVDSLALLMTRVTMWRWLHTHTGHLHSVLECTDSYTWLEWCFTTTNFH